MSNFELIDDYLGNRLNEPDRKAFEQQLEGDPSLKAEVDFQQQIIESVKAARITELKTMLNNVPVGGSMWTGTKLAASIVSAGVVSTLLYFYLNGDPATVVIEDNQPKEEVVMPADVTAIKEEEPTVTTPGVKDSDQSDDQSVIKGTKKSTKTTKVPSPVHKPTLDPIDPSIDLADSEKDKANPTVERKSDGDISVSKMEVITGLNDKKHDFHYQFSDGKLKLYGPFDRSLYEILEIHGVSHAVFLFYKENYYLMNEDQSEITPLQLIKDAQLLKKLKEYQGR